MSKGTYIRTLAEDIGEALGCGAHLIALRRTATGHFDASQCVTLEAVEAMNEQERLSCLRPVDALLPDHEAVTLDADNAGRFLSGLRRRGEWSDNENIAVYGPSPVRAGPALRQAQDDRVLSPPTSSGRTVLLGTAHTKAGELIPGRLLAPTEIQQILEPRT